MSGLSKSERVLCENKLDSLDQTPTMVKPPKAKKVNLVATAKDNKGDEIYNIHIYDAHTSRILEIIKGVTSRFEWVSGKALVYIAMDEITRRPHMQSRHKFGFLPYTG